MCTVYDVLVAAKVSIVLLSRIPSIVLKRSSLILRRRILSSSDASSTASKSRIFSPVFLGIFAAVFGLSGTLSDKPF